MEIKITRRDKNPVTEREEIRFELEHKNAPTPSRADVIEQLSSELGESEDLIVIEKIATPHGRQIASGIARVYETEERLKELEQEYLAKRTEVSKEKKAEKEEESEPEEETEDEQTE